MHAWTEKSLKLANSPGYLDRLHEIYPISSNPERQIDEGIIPIVQKLHAEGNAAELVRQLLKLKKFPLDEPYMGSLRLSGNFEKNPHTVERIGKLLLGMKTESLISLCRQPKSGTRQMGPSFKNWLHGKGKYEFLPAAEFKKADGACFLDGSDTTLENYANRELKAKLSKGIDFVFKAGRTRHVVGEAKFITTHGGTQTNQLNVALGLTERKIRNTLPVAVVDGAAWFNNGYIRKIRSKGGPIISALLLFDFLENGA